MARSEFTVLVSDLVGHPGRRREITVSGPLEIDMPHARATARPAVVTARVDATTDGVVVTGEVAAEVILVCTRCLSEIVHDQTAGFRQVFGFVESDDVEPISQDGMIDLEPVAHDELSLELPLVPLCRADCRGLCPTCGTDLNTDPCSGHSEESDSPFAALRDLIDPSTVDPAT